MKKLKKVIISLAAVAVVGIGGFFGWRYLQQNNVQPVKVFPFDFVGMTEYWGDTRESYGPVSTDKIQTIYLSDTQTVSQILVEEGQQVQAGDLLMSFDTTLSQLELERKNLEIQKLQMELDEAYKEAQRISWMVPMGSPPTEPSTEPTEPDLGRGLSGEFELFRQGHDGSSQESAFICWIPVGKEISTEFLQEQIGSLIGEVDPTIPSTEPTEPETPTEPVTEPPTTLPTREPGRRFIGSERVISYTAILTEEETTEPSTQPETTEAPSSPEETTTAAEETTAPTEGTTGPTEETTAPTEETTQSTAPVEEKYGTVTCTDAVNIRSGPGTDYLVVDFAVNNQRVTIYEIVEVSGTPWGRIGQDRWICLIYVVLDGATTQPTEPQEPTIQPTEPEEPTEPTQPTSPMEPTIPSEPTEPSEPDDPTEPTEEPEKRCRPYYVIFKVTEGDMLKGEVLVWQGAHVREDGSFSFFDARQMEDYSIPPDPPEETEPYVDYIGSGFTYSEIQKMKQEQARKIKDLEIQLRLAQSELRIMERELSDGNIYAEQDGKVISLLSEEDARLNSQPIMKVSAGGGYYVEASINELERDTVEPGMEVTVIDWETGNSYTGVVASVGDIPTSGKMQNGMSNPNSSGYPFRIFVDESADLRADSYVSVQYSSAAEGGIYLQNPFLRTIQGRSFVYVLGQDGKLEERTVTIGKNLGGSYTQILEGLTTQDLIAFPYGKNVKPGAPAEEGDMSDLYN